MVRMRRRVMMVRRTMMRRRMVMMVRKMMVKQVTQEENDYTLCPHTAVGVAFHYSIPPTIPRVNIFTS